VDENPYLSPQIPACKAQQQRKRNWRRDIVILGVVAVVAAPVLYGLELAVYLILQNWLDP